ncbi:hypothetical protein N7468_004158 [Penicillium chermesinum]|uniref:Uncharacterized protein n=1 Tax=Penicillium chermesinum TaxID=63820 RepID=A0A9W9P7T5_9EURO|nr:uncharacterized protein N7468_004158 [Penicillium chermesinum]KAJ5239539.1 hypothetical protein N7468_004158 [Penicillium chermesinum]
MGSSTGSGFFKGDGNGNFWSTFILPSNGVSKSFNGKFSSAVPKFICTLAQVEFDKESALEGDYAFGENATIGPTTINLPLAEGIGSVSITGKLTVHLPKAYTATGPGHWDSS